MKRLTLAVLAGLTAATMAVPSFAADLPRPAYKAPIYTAPLFSWTGFYVGANIGYGWGTTNWTVPATGATTGNFNTKGWLGGVTLGYNFQGGNFVYGIEGDWALSENRGTDTATCGPAGCETRNLWFATVRGRLGYAFDRFLPYITGGLAVASIKMIPPFSDGTKQTKFGWTLGAGLEYAFLGAWSAKIEYLYADLGKATCSAATCGLDTDVSWRSSFVRAGVNYRF